MQCPDLQFGTYIINKSAIILNITHNILNRRDTEMVIYKILGILKRVNGINHYLNIR
jgi:hypothetical protein